MPEYLTPAVYLEEVSFRSRPIEGVPTSTFGMAGRTEYGPVPVPIGSDPVTPSPLLVTSITEYQRAFGGLMVGGEYCQLALAARAFFANGGRRLYVSRVFPYTMTQPGPAGGQPQIDVDRNFASLTLPTGAAANQAVLRWRARWPGEYARGIRIRTEFRRSRNVLLSGALRGVQPGAAVEVVNGATGNPPPDGTPPAALRIVERNGDGVLGYRAAGSAVDLPNAASRVYHVTLVVTVEAPEGRTDTYAELELDPAHPRSVFTVLQHRDPPDELALVWLDDTLPTPGPAQPPTPLQQLTALLSTGAGQFLTGGGAGLPLSPDALLGRVANPDDFRVPATGLEALAELEDIAIVACPDIVDLADQEQITATGNLITHCERPGRYRMGIVDAPRDSSISEVREFRAKFDSTYAALYYPWVRVVDPTKRPDPGGPTPMVNLPPSGYVAGIYARSDGERGVHKAPANEVVRAIDSLVTNVTFDRQSVLNPEGVNALRFFEGRANRVWGARTMTSDPEWKYVNVRRLFIYLEHSIDRATQYAVFEPNNEALWASIRRSITDFLLATWRTGALMGVRPEEAFFVRCDRTTMSQNDLDNGRMICLIGVAPTYPAEFVIFRIGQWTADAQRT